MAGGQVYVDNKSYAFFFFPLKTMSALAHACTEEKLGMFAQFKLVNKYLVLMRFSMEL